MEKHGEISPLMNLREPATGCTPIMFAAIENKITLMGKMITLGCSINQMNKVRVVTPDLFT